MKIADFKLERYFAKYEFKAPFLLSSSDCESLTIRELLDLEEDAPDEFMKLPLGYTESEGHPELRKNIASLYSSIGPDDILAFSGAQEGIFVLMNTLLEPTDHAIVLFPAYQSLFEVANAIGCQVSKWAIKEENNWLPDFGELKRLIQPNTKLIVINVPHNPTGMMLSLEKQQELVEISRASNIYLFSDEVYRFLEIDATPTLPGVCDLYDKGISLGVMSKSFGLAGLRIGWLATRDRNLIGRFNKYKDYTSICASAPSEYLATLALTHRDVILERTNKIVTDNLEVLDKFFERYNNLFSWVRPKGGSVGFVRYKGNEKISDFCLKVVEEAGIMLLPGSTYDFEGKFFRIGFGRNNLPVVIEKFEKYLNQK